MTIGPGYGAVSGDRTRMLASTADRDRAVDYLKTAFAEGRLGPEEYDARLSRALTARTYTDLDALIVDLPGARPPVPPGPPRTNALAITSLAFGIGQFLGLLLLGTIPAVVCGHVARRQIRRSGEGGAGLALAGLILGWTGVALTVAVIAAVAVVVGAVLHHGAAVHVPPPP